MQDTLAKRVVVEILTLQIVHLLRQLFRIVVMQVVNHIVSKKSVILVQSQPMRQEDLSPIVNQ